KYLFMSNNDQPMPLTAVAVGQHIVDRINQFLEQPPAGMNTKNWLALKDRIFLSLQSLDANVVFFGLLWILETQTRYQYQLVAGELLCRTSLKSPLPLLDLLERIVPGFELSASTVPEYLAGTFGREAVMECLNKMQSISPENEAKIETIRYWLSRVTDR